SPKEMEEVFSLEVSDDFEAVRNRLIVELLYATGIRKSELIAIELRDIHTEARSLKIRGKGNKERLIPLFESLLAGLEAYLIKRGELEKILDEEYLFLTGKTKKIYDMLVYRVVNDFFAKVSTKLKTSPHILRHSFATHLLNK